MIVVVAGGSGQLGTLVVSRLIASRKVKRIIALDSIPPAVTSPKLHWTIAHPGDPGLGRHFEGADALVYVGMVPPSEQAAAPEVEAESGRRIFREAVGGGIHHLLFVSSLAAYGIVEGHSCPIVETTPRRPGPQLSGTAHFELEQALDELEGRHPSLRVVRLRPGIPLGRRLEHPLSRALRRRIMPKLGSARWPIVWDEDVADAIVLALLSPVRGAFNLVAAEPLAVAELAQAGGMRLLPMPRAALDGISRVGPLLGKIGLRASAEDAWLEATRTEIVASNERALSELGWKPSCPTAKSVIRRYADDVPRALDRRIVIFMRVARAAAERLADAEIPAQARTLVLTVHLNLTGPGGGDYTLNVDHGRPSVTRGVPRPVDAVVTLRAETLLAMLSGQLDVASARFAGKILVHGEPFAGFVIAGLVAGFRRATGLGGARGYASRKLSSWFARGAPAARAQSTTEEKER